MIQVEGLPSAAGEWWAGERLARAVRCRLSIHFESLRGARQQELVGCQEPLYFAGLMGVGLGETEGCQGPLHTVGLGGAGQRETEGCQDTLPFVSLRGEGQWATECCLSYLYVSSKGAEQRGTVECQGALFECLRGPELSVTECLRGTVRLGAVGTPYAPAYPPLWHAECPPREGQGVILRLQCHLSPTFWSRRPGSIQVSRHSRGGLAGDMKARM